MMGLGPGIKTIWAATICFPRPSMVSCLPSLWSAACRPVATLTGHGAAVGSLATNEHSHQLLSCDQEGRIKVGACVQRSGHQGDREARGVLRLWVVMRVAHESIMLLIMNGIQLSLHQRASLCSRHYWQACNLASQRCLQAMVNVRATLQTSSTSSTSFANLSTPLSTRCGICALSAACKPWCCPGCTPAHLARPPAAAMVATMMMRLGWTVMRACLWCVCARASVCACTC